MKISDFPSRRQVLNGGAILHPVPEAHISSLVIHVRPENVAAACSALASMPGVEIHAEVSGKMVVTLETETEGDIVTRMNEISLLDGVMSTALVFHHFEREEDAPKVEQG